MEKEFVRISGKDYAEAGIASGELKPIDVKRLMEDKILTESMLEEIFKSDELNENQKLIL